MVSEGLFEDEERKFSLVLAHFIWLRWSAALSPPSIFLYLKIEKRDFLLCLRFKNCVFMLLKFPFYSKEGSGLWLNLVKHRIEFVAIGVMKKLCPPPFPVMPSSCSDFYQPGVDGWSGNGSCCWVGVRSNWIHLFPQCHQLQTVQSGTRCDHSGKFCCWRSSTFEKLLDLDFPANLLEPVLFKP